MMNLKSIITKGILSTYQGVGLATKGFVDLRVRVKRVIGRFIHIEYPFKFEINVVGTKAIRFKLEYEVRGIVKSSLSLSYRIVGKVKSRTSKQYFIKAIKTTSLTKKIDLQAIQARKLQRGVTLRGVLSVPYALIINVLGTKRFLLNKVSNIAGKRSTKAFTNFSLTGTKKNSFNQVFPIKAKKDITPILTALDLV